MGPEYAAGHYTHLTTVDTPENKAFVEQFKAKFGQDRVTNGVSGVFTNLLYGSSNGKLLDEGKLLLTTYGKRLVAKFSTQP